MDDFEGVCIGIVDNELELGIGLNVWYLSLSIFKILISFLVYNKNTMKDSLVKTVVGWTSIKSGFTRTNSTSTTVNSTITIRS